MQFFHKSVTIQLHLGDVIFVYFVENWRRLALLLCGTHLETPKPCGDVELSPQEDKFEE